MRKYETIETFPEYEHWIALSSKNRLSLKKSYQGVLYEWPNGTGKSSVFITPQIFTWEGSMVVIDAVAKTSIYESTSWYMKKKWYNVVVFRPDNPYQSDHFNPLSVLKTSDQISQVSEYFAGRIASNNDPIWHEASSNIINVLLTVLKRTKDKSLFNLHNVAYLLKKFGNQWEGIKDFVYKTLNPETGWDKETREDFLEITTNLSPATLQGVLFSAITALRLWRRRTDNISVLTSDNTFDLSRIRKEKTIVYIILPKQKIYHYNTFIDLFILSAFEQSAMDGVKKGMLPLAYFLDEFGNLKIHNFDGYASVLRDFDISLNCYVQTQSQIKANYSDRWNTIVSNLRTKVFLNWMDDETCIKVSRALGKRTVHELAEEKTKDSKKKTITTKIDLMTPDQVRMIKENEAIVISANLKPVYLKGLKGYYQNSTFKKYAKYWSFKKEFSYFKEEVKRKSPVRQIVLEEKGVKDLTI